MAPRYHYPHLPDTGRVELGEDLTHHLLRVMRLQQGDEVLLFDGRGHQARARITQTDARTVHVDILERSSTAAQPVRIVEIAFSPPRSNRWSWLLEKVAELGVATLRPVLCSRTPASARREKNRLRQERILSAATAQSGAVLVPTLYAPVSLADFVEQSQQFTGQRFVADGDGATASARSAEPCLVLVGPEGGLTDQELAMVEAAGFAKLRLGPTTLRVETAALVAATLLLHAADQA